MCREKRVAFEKVPLFGKDPVGHEVAQVFVAALRKNGEPSGPAPHERAWLGSGPEQATVPIEQDLQVEDPAREAQVSDVTTRGSEGILTSVTVHLRRTGGHTSACAQVVRSEPIRGSTTRQRLVGSGARARKGAGRTRGAS